MQEGCQVGLNIERWFNEVTLLLQCIECKLLHHGACCYSTLSYLGKCEANVAGLFLSCGIVMLPDASYCMVTA